MNHGREGSRFVDIAVSSGSGSGLIARTWDVAPRWRVIPPSESAEYDVSIKDGGDNLIIKRTDQTGSLSEENHISLGIASSIAIENASEDGVYRVIFDMH